MPRYSHTCAHDPEEGVSPPAGETRAPQELFRALTAPALHQWVHDLEALADEQDPAAEVGGLLERLAREAAAGVWDEDDHDPS